MSQSIFHYLFILLTANFLCCATSALAGSAKKAQYDSAKKTARQALWKILSDGSASSASIAIMDSGKLVYNEQFGMRDRLKSIPVDKNTQFNIGSVSKVFTAVAILTLVDQGKVKLDKPVTTYLPDFTMLDERYKDITVRMLLNHTSGFPGSNYKDSFGTAYNPDYVSETMNCLAKSKLKSTPGEISVYCNDGFTLAEAVIERVSGLSYANYIAKYIFKPCGMKNSSCDFKSGNTNIAVNYESGLTLPAEIISILGSGGISSTPKDLCAFSRILYHKKLLSENSLEEFTKPQYGPETALTLRPWFNCGLGWDMVALNDFAEQDVTVLSKNGSTDEFSTQLLADPSHKLTVALTVCGKVDAQAIATLIMQALLEGKGIVPGGGSISLPPDTTTIPEATLAYAGYYGNDLAIMKIEFDTSNNMMMFYKWDGGQFLLSSTLPYRQDGYFYMGEQKCELQSKDARNYFLLVFGNTLPYYMVFAERIQQITNPEWDGSSFVNSTWYFSNLNSREFGGGPIATGSIPELPGYIFSKGSGACVIYKLTGTNTTEMCLPYARDLLPPNITETSGVRTLSAGNYQYTSISSFSSLADGDTITTSNDEPNAWRSIDQKTVFSCEMSAGGRIMIFTSDNEPLFDSIMGETFPTIIPAGSHVAFIGATGATFTVKLSSSIPLSAPIRKKGLRPILH